MAWTSPRTTQLLHQVRHLSCFSGVRLVLHQRARFGRKATAESVAPGGLGDGLPGGLGPADAAMPGDVVKSAETLRAQAQGKRRCGLHGKSVARNALHELEWGWASIIPAATGGAFNCRSADSAGSLGAEAQRVLRDRHLSPRGLDRPLRRDFSSGLGWNRAPHLSSAVHGALQNGARKPRICGAYIGAPRFELGTSPTRTVRATRLRHAPI
jgi:hypothetical protein